MKIARGSTRAARRLLCIHFEWNAQQNEFVVSGLNGQAPGRLIVYAMDKNHAVKRLDTILASRGYTPEGKDLSWKIAIARSETVLNWPR